MNTGGPAYPQHGWTKDPEVAQRMGNQGGMTLLDWMAGQVMNGWAAGRNNNMIENSNSDSVAQSCYAYASAMIAEKARREGDHSGDANKMVEDHSPDAGKMVEINRELVEALEWMVYASEDVQSKGYAFARLDAGVVIARTTLAKHKEAKP